MTHKPNQDPVDATMAAYKSLPSGDVPQACADYVAALEAALASKWPQAHPDDLAVERFAASMKLKMKWEREERGRSGWDDPEACTPEYLARLLVEHLEKGNPGNLEDVANFCMMLHQRGCHPRVVAEAAAARRAGGDAEPLKRPELLRSWTAPFRVTVDGVRDAKGCWIFNGGESILRQIVELLNYAAAVGSDPAGHKVALEKRVTALEQAAEHIAPYLRWTIGDESPGHHPTMPSAVGAFMHACKPVGQKAPGAQAGNA